MRGQNQEMKGKKFRNRTETTRTIKETAFRIIRTDGIKGLKISKVQELTGRNRKLIYDYFGGLDGLLKTVLEENDPWIFYENYLDSILDLHRESHGKELAPMLLKNHLDSFKNDKLAQDVALLELLDKDSDLLREISFSRERLGDKLFVLAEKHFRNSDVEIRLVFALLIGGINYMVLHRQSNGSTFCGADIEKEDDFRKLNKTLEQIVKWAYDYSKTTKQEQTEILKKGECT